MNWRRAPPQGFVQDLLSRIDIVEGGGPGRVKAGINQGLCPFHGEDAELHRQSRRQTTTASGAAPTEIPSASLTETSGIGFMDAVRDLAQQAGLTVPQSRSDPQDQARSAAERASSGWPCRTLSSRGRPTTGKR